MGGVAKSRLRIPRALGAVAAILACSAALGACGSSGGSNGVASTPGSTSRPPEQLGSPLSRGDREPASGLHLSRADCARLASALEAHLGRPVRRASEPTPPLSRCGLIGSGVDVHVFLDTAHSAPQRYRNRMDEQVQFGAPDAAKVPHPVAGVGEPAAYDHDASWLPAYDTLFALRGSRWLTIAYSRPGVSPHRLLPEAARLARLAFRLTAS